MKKLVAIIIAILGFFSIVNISNAQEGYIEKLLDLNYGVEDYNINLNFNNLKNFYFYDSNTNSMYREFLNINETLKNQIIDKYRNGEIDYYTTRGVVSNYNKYIYHTNKIFEYISIKEQRSGLIEADIALEKNYELSRSYYKRVKYLLLK